MGNRIGYVTAWNSTTIINNTTRFATTYTDDGIIVKPRIIVLPNGTKVNYDGTGTSPASLGKITQEFYDEGGPTFTDLVATYLGVFAEMSMKQAEGTVLLYADAILIDVKDTTPVQGTRNTVWCSLTWELMSTWSPT